MNRNYDCLVISLHKQQPLVSVLLSLYILLIPVEVSGCKGLAPKDDEQGGTVVEHSQRFFFIINYDDGG